MNKFKIISNKNTQVKHLSSLVLGNCWKSCDQTQINTLSSVQIDNPCACAHHLLWSFQRAVRTLSFRCFGARAEPSLEAGWGGLTPSLFFGIWEIKKIKEQRGNKQTMYLLLLAPPDSNSYQFWSSRRLARRRPFCGSVEFVLSLCSPAQCRRCVRKFGRRDNCKRPLKETVWPLVL